MISARLSMILSSVAPSSWASWDMILPNGSACKNYNSWSKDISTLISMKFYEIILNTTLAIVMENVQLKSSEHWL